MKILSVIVVISVVCLMISPADAGEKVAVLDFKSISAPADLGMAVAEILRTELVGLGEYTVIERGMLEQVMQEQSLQLTGAVESETAVQIGKLVGAKLVVIGSIVKTGSVYTINARFIDVETGIAKIGQNIRGQGEDQISNMVHQLALVITGKAVVTEEGVPAVTITPQLETTPAPIAQPAGIKLLFSFENQAEIRQWETELNRSSSQSLADDHVTEGTHSLRINFTRSDAWQALRTTSIPADWSPYRILAFDLYSNAKQADAIWPLVVRVDDQQTTQIAQNWFAQEYTIAPGAATIRVYIEDIGKKLDLKHIKRVALATHDLTQDVEVYLDHTRFENVLPPAPTKPFLMSFEIKGEESANWIPNGRLVHLEQSDQYTSQGKYSLQVELPRKSFVNEYPGIFLSTFPRDWSHYKQFSLDLYYEQKRNETVTLGIRIDDTASTSYQTRFNWDIRLKPGVNEIRIPVETIRKAIDISKIQTVHLFLVESKERTRFYLDNIRVE